LRDDWASAGANTLSARWNRYYPATVGSAGLPLGVAMRHLRTASCRVTLARLLSAPSIPPHPFG